VFRLIIVVAAAFSSIAAPAAMTIRLAGTPDNPARRAAAIFENRLKGLDSSLSIEARQGEGKPESFTISRPRAGVVYVTGGDSVGLAYGLYELLAQIETKGAEGVKPEAREAAVRKRGMTVFLYNEQLESAWLYDRGTLLRAVGAQSSELLHLGVRSPDVVSCSAFPLPDRSAWV
jgi:hypothetical protein